MKVQHRPFEITYQNLTASPEEWAEMIGVSATTFYQTAEKVGWKEACNLKNYKLCNELNCNNCNKHCEDKP